MIHRRAASTLISIAVAMTLVACGGDDDPVAMAPTPTTIGPAGPPAGPAFPATVAGDATAGRDVFLFETFGNERFWTDAVRLPQGMVAAGVTPMQALRLGLVVDVNRLPTATRTAIAAQLATDPTGNSSALLNDPATTLALINANAVVGFSLKDTNGDGVLNVSNGDKVGATCALCHAVTDGSVLRVANGGSIGARVDGAANHNLDFATLVSVGTNSRALYPILQLNLAANGNTTLGRAPLAAALTETSTEAQVDAYLTNKNWYPVGMFDDTFDGNGDPMHNSVLFQQDLAAPYGSEGTFTKQDDFANLVYTGLLDPTTLTTPNGRAFLAKLGGAAGTEIANDYVQVLAATGVTGYPYVTTTAAPTTADVGSLAYPLGIRVNEQKLRDLNAFLFALPSPAGVASARAPAGATLFRNSGCTGCHNVDQTIPVPTFLVPMNAILPTDAPVTLAQRTAPLNPVLNTVGSIFDDKWAVVNASIRGDIRGVALPLLLDLNSKPVFLHDNSVASLDSLLDPARGNTAPHPFFISSATDRSDVIAYLRAQEAR